MKKSQIIRAWRNSEYYASLSAEQRAQVPANPAGVMDIDDAALNSVAGGCGAYKDCSGSNDTTPGSTALCSGCPPCYCY